MAIINGTSFNDNLIGTSDSDTISGFAGDDTLEGKTGNDFLYGGLGDDLYFLNDVFTSGTGLTQTRSYDTVTENAGEGTDAVAIDGDANPLVTSYTLRANIEHGFVVGTSNFNLTGNALNNELAGNSANNTLRGLAGADILYGGLGNDIYILGDVFTSGFGLTQTRSYDTVIEDVGEGTDLVRIASNANPLLTSYSLKANIENGIVDGASNFNLSGNVLDNWLAGNSAKNTLRGLAGNDLINGGFGDDKLIGGAGDDIYILGDVYTSGSGVTLTRSYDTVTENAGEGIDAVRIASDANPLLTSYSLTANIENGTVDGASNFDLTGNALNNRLTGNSATNILKGLGGGDILNGGLGEDKLIGGTGDDVYILADAFPNFKNYIVYDEPVENAGEGIDGVEVSSDTAGYAYVLGNNIEWGVITGTTSFFVLSGNALGNTLYGSDQTHDILNGAGNARGNDSDVLFGYGGDDTLYASNNGRDVMYGGLGNDKFFFGEIDSLSSGSESDVIMDFSIGFDGISNNDVGDTSIIDAKASVEGNNSFTFIGSAPFTAEGQISATQVGADTVLSLNTSGTTDAEMQIMLMGVDAASLTQAHFIL